MEEVQEPETIEADVMDRQCWLMRVPNELAAQWEKAEIAWGAYHMAKARADEKPGAAHLQTAAQQALKAAEDASNLGQIKIEATETKTVGTLTSPGPDGAPLTYKMNLEGDERRVGDNAPHLRILTETLVREEDVDDPTRKLRVAATVTDYWTVQGRAGKDANLAAGMVQNKLREANRPMIEDEDDDLPKSAVGGFIRPMQQKELDQRQQQKDERRLNVQMRSERKSRDHVINDLFGLFEEKVLWTFKELRERTKQPDDHLKDCLEAVAERHKEGPNLGKWQRKE